MRTLLLIIFIAFKSSAQVGIGTRSPNPHAQLEIMAKNKGILIPKAALVDTKQTTPIDNSRKDIPESLLIYNINKNDNVTPGYYYWNNNKWNRIITSEEETLTALNLITDSLTDNHGYGIKKLLFTYSDEKGKENTLIIKENLIPIAIFHLHCNEISYKGNYTVNKYLEQSEYLSIPVTINKTGYYTIIGETSNGFYFEGSGYFPVKGKYPIILQGYGTPIEGKETEITFSINGTNQTNGINTIVKASCKLNIDVKSEADYTFICDKILVNGKYLKGIDLSSNETITLDVWVKKTGSYQIKAESSPNNGYSFSANGTFTETGIHQITLTGTGIPKEAIKSPFSITTNENDKTCSFNIEIPSATFDITSCNAIKAKGIYKEGIPLSDENTIEIQVDVKTPGAYTIKAASDNGYAFEYRGNLTQTGNTTIKLLPTPESVPLKAQKDNITITANQTISSCKLQITVLTSPESVTKNNTLNVVYFLPSDIPEPLGQYKRRLSTIMLFMQNWFQKEMESYGLGPKTFGLLRDKTNKDYIKIMIIRGKEGKQNYRYNGGGSKAIKEIDEYFSKNPTEKGSEHTLVFMASLTGDGKGNNEGGVPFYGIGKYCFALDYRYFDVSFFPKETDTAKIGWFAGTAHELGHGLNLPHNHEKANDTFKALMSGSHGTFETNHEKSHLTFASACILDNSETFNTGKQYYKLKPNLNIKGMHIYADKDKIYFNAKFSASVNPGSVIIYNDPQPNPKDADYNAITWATKDIKKTGSFYTVSMEMAVSDLKGYQQYPFAMRIRFVFENGNSETIYYNYTFENGKATIDEEVIDFEKIATNNWTIQASSTSAPKGAYNMFDNDLNTVWHSKWSGGTDPMPYIITVNMDKITTLEGIAFIARQERSDGRPKNVTVETSTNGTDWNNTLNLELKDTKALQTYRFNSILNTKYIRIIIHDIYKGSIKNPEYAHLAELQFF